MDRVILNIKTLGILIVILISLNLQGQTMLDLEGIANGSLKTKIETNTAKFFDRINMAYRNDSNPNYDDIDITDDAKVEFQFIWSTSPLLISEAEIYDKLLQKVDNKNQINGYEIRRVRVFIKEAEVGRQNKEIVISFDKSGQIIGMHFPLDVKLYGDVMTEGKKVKDVRKRQIILDFVESFRTAYNKKDISFIEQVFSDEALIIVGKKVQPLRKKNDGVQLPDNDLTSNYISKSKAQYIQSLKGAFNKNEYINIDFSDLILKKHNTIKDMYGVTIAQNWKSSTYNDTGYVFLCIDLRDDARPIIHVRTWTEKDEFNLESFDWKKLKK
ncbi:MAG: hypothetical protein ACPGSD_09685 [Flavobacteriales bacterium]